MGAQPLPAHGALRITSGCLSPHPLPQPNPTKRLVEGPGKEEPQEGTGQHIPESRAPGPAALVQFSHPFSPKEVSWTPLKPGSSTQRRGPCFPNLYNGVSGSRPQKSI